MQHYQTGAAIFRILSDLVKSDAVITRCELRKLDSHLRSFAVGELDRQAGYGMTLGEAVEILRGSSRALRSVLCSAMRDIAISDNECCRNEAMLIASMERLDASGTVRIVSRPVGNSPLLTTQLLYLDRAESISSRCLDKEFAEISRIVEVAGLELVHIPEIVRNVRLWGDGNEDSLIDVLRLLYPTSSREELAGLARSVLALDTPTFCSEVLRDRMGIQMDIDAPSWLLRLCDDTVGGVPYSNFLCVRIDQKNMKAQLRRIVDTVNALQGSYSILVNRHKKGSEDFQYGEFHRILFDALSGPKPDGWKLNFYCQRYCPKRTPDGRRCQVSYLGEDGREIPLALSGREAAFLLLLVSASKEGGLNLRDSSLQERYARCYSEISPRENVPDICVSSTLRPIKHRVVKAIEASSLPDIHRFLPRTVGSRLCLSVAMDNVQKIQ